MSHTTLTIGGFARLTGLSVRALRLYDEQGLLPPRTVDATSRYRRNAVDRLARGALIARPRRLDLPLDELRTFLDATVQRTNNRSWSPTGNGWSGGPRRPPTPCAGWIA